MDRPGPGLGNTVPGNHRIGVRILRGGEVSLPPSLRLYPHTMAVSFPSRLSLPASALIPGASKHVHCLRDTNPPFIIVYRSGREMSPVGLHSSVPKQAPLTGSSCLVHHCPPGPLSWEVKTSD